MKNKILSISWLTSILCHSFILAPLILTVRSEQIKYLNMPSETTTPIIYANLVYSKKNHKLNKTNQMHQNKPKEKPKTVKQTESLKSFETKKNNQPKTSKPQKIKPKIENTNTKPITSRFKPTSQVKDAVINKKDIVIFLKALNQQLQKQLWQIDSRFYKRLSGQVIIEFNLTPSGQLEQIKLFKSSGYQTLDSLTINLIKHLDLSEIKIPPIAELIKLQLPVNFEQGL